VSYSVSANSGAERYATILVGDKTLQLRQQGCSSVSASSLSPSTGGSSNVNVTASGCTWSAISNASWLSVSGTTSGTSNGTLTITAAPRQSRSARTGTVWVNGNLVTVTQ